jgi:hypothetical protein
MDVCYAKYADGFDSGTWHGCEKQARKEYIMKYIEKDLVDKICKK